MDGAEEAQSGVLVEGVDTRGAGVWLDDHVRGLNASPTTDRTSIKAEAFVEDIFVEVVGGDGEVLPGAEEVDELDVDEADLFVFDQGEDVSDAQITHGVFLWGRGPWDPL